MFLKIETFHDFAKEPFSNQNDPVFECNACQEKCGAFKEFRGGKTAVIQPKPAA